MLSWSIWFSAPSFWMGGDLESRCVGRVYGADVVVHGNIRTVHTRPTQRLSIPPPIQISVQKTICCNSTSNAPDDERTYPKHVELRVHQ